MTFQKKCIALLKKELMPECGKVYVKLFTVDKVPKRMEHFGGAAFFHYGETLEIQICDDMAGFMGKEIFAEGHDYRIKEFVESLCLPYDDEAKFLFVLLHEFGHAHILKLFADNDMRAEYHALASLDVSKRIMYESAKECMDIWKEDLGMPLHQFVQTIEAQADIFAMKKFFPLWKKLHN